MKILMVANAQASHTQRWSRGLVDRGHDVVLVSVRNADLDDVEVRSVLGVKSPTNRQLVAGYARLTREIARAVRELEPTVVHAHYASTNGFSVSLAGVRPTVLTAWGSDVIPKPGRTNLPLPQRLRSRRAVRYADAVTAASPFLAKHIEVLAPGTRVQVVPFGVDTSVFASRPRPLGHTILVAKSLEPRYGVDHVIEAMKYVQETSPDARLWIAGEGSQRRALESLARDIGVRVTFLGGVSNDHVSRLMAQCDVVVNPTIVEESFGVVLLEAQSVGRPVVSTAVGAVADVVTEGETAILVPPADPESMADAITRVLTGAALTNAESVGPPFVRQRYSWRSSLDLMESVLESVVQ